MQTYKLTPRELESLQAIPARQLKRSSMPIAKYLQEADNLYVWSKDDWNALIAAGLPESIFERLLKRTELCRNLEAEWNRVRLVKNQNTESFRALLKEAFEVQKLLVHSFRYAFRNEPELLVKLKRAVKKSPYAALFQSLNNLAVFGEQHMDLLQQISFQENLLGRARELSEQLPELYAQLPVGKNEIKDLRDRSYTYLKQVVDEIRDCGKYVFRDQPERQYGYCSPYMRQKGLSQRQAKRRKSDENESAE